MLYNYVSMQAKTLLIIVYNSRKSYLCNTEKNIFIKLKNLTSSSNL
jgi:hypothetical protein